MTQDKWRSTLRFTRCLMVVLAFILAPEVRASIAVAIPFDSKVDKADGIVVGRCLRTKSELDPTGRWIVTYSTFAVTKSLKGSRQGEVTIVTPGGQVDKINQSTVGVPRFAEGETNVVFLKEGAVGPSVLYFDQGAYDVVSGSGGEVMVEPVQSDLVLIDGQTGLARTAGESRRSLRDFEANVARSLSDSRQRRIAAASSSREASFASGRSVRKMIEAVPELLHRNRWVVLALAIGLVLATIPLLRRR